MSHNLITTLHINSRDRISGTPSNFTVRFTPTITNCNSVAVKSVTISYSYYNINSSNNVLSFIETTGGGTQTITIPVGNYTSSVLASTIQNLLTAASANGYTYVVSISTVSYKTTLQITSAGFPATNYLFSLNPSLGKILGFSGDTGLTANVVSPNAANLTGSQKLYVISRALTSSPSPIAYSAGVEKNILTEVPVNVGPNNTIIYLPTVEYWGGLSMNLDVIDIQVVDDAFNEVDLNGVDWNISVAVSRQNAFV